MSKPRKTKITTFRADAVDIEKLAKVAEKKMISLNALLSQIVRSYLEWELMAPELGIIPIHKETIKELVNSMEDDRLREIAIKSADSFMSHMIMFTGVSSLDAFLQITRTRAQKSGFSIVETIRGDIIQMAINHGMGLKWSIFFSTYHERILNNLGYRAEIEVTDEVKVIRILLDSIDLHNDEKKQLRSLGYSA